MTLRQKTADLLATNRVRNFIVAVIIFNAIILGMETSKSLMEAAGPLIIALDRICLSIFVLELAAKLFAQRLQFFRNGWNIFDFVIVGVSLIPGNGGLSVLRALRILRVLRVISVVPSLRRVVEGFVTALPGMGSVFLLMGIVFYIAAVMATKLFGDAFPEWFGTLGRSGYSLFQIMSLLCPLHHGHDIRGGEPAGRPDRELYAGRPRRRRQRGNRRLLSYSRFLLYYIRHIKPNTRIYKFTY